MAAILRAKVRRAIGGFMPLSDASLVEILERPSCGSRSGGSSLKDIFQIMIVIFVQSADGHSFLRAFQLTANESDIPHYRRFQCVRSRPTAAAWYGSDGVSASEDHKAARIGPIEGICRQQSHGRMFRDSAIALGALPGAKQLRHQLLIVDLGATAHATSVIFASHSAR